MALQVNKSLKALVIKRDISPNTTATFITHAGCKIESGGAGCIAEALQVNTSLQVLDISSAY